MSGFVDTITSRYRGGRDRLFILHGNTNDLFPLPISGTDDELLSLPDYLYRAISGTKDNNRIWLHHSLGYDTRSIGDEKTQGFVRLEKLAKGSSGKIQIPGAPINFFRLLDALCLRREKPANEKTEGALVPLRVIVTDAHLVIPEAQTVFMRPEDRELLVLLRRFASEPRYDATDMLLILITDALSGIHHELRECAVTVEIPRPDEQVIGAHLERVTSGKNVIEPDKLAPMKRLAVGLTVRQVQNVVAEHIATKLQLTPTILTNRRRELIGRDYGDFLEFFDPTWTLDDVGGSVEAVAEMRWLAQALKDGRRDVPTGISLTGQNGIGKTFIVKGFLGTAGITGVFLKSFLDSLLGAAERNWEKIATALRSAGQIAVAIDEADSQMGQRTGPNIHEVSKKVFAAQMQLMGDPEFRGRIFWILMTCRPDKLAPDVKRPGRCERMIPLFPVTTNQDAVAILTAQVNLRRKKDGYIFTPDLQETAVGELLEITTLLIGKTGAQIEKLLHRANRASKRQPISRELLLCQLQADQEFQAEPAAYELQRLIAMVEAVETENVDLIPPFYRQQLAGKYGGVEQAKRRIQELRYLVDGV